MKKSIILLYSCLILTPAIAQEVHLPLLFQDKAHVMSTAWQRTFEGIKTQVNKLVDQNNELVSRYNGLKAQCDQVLLAIGKQSSDNERLEALLAERKGRTDQQVRIDELVSQVTVKRTRLAAKELESTDLHRKANEVGRLIELKKLKISELELFAGQKTAPSQQVGEDAQLVNLRKDYEAQQAQEALLNERLQQALGHKSSSEIVLLGEKLESLNRQKEALLKESSLKGPSPNQRSRYAIMQTKKGELENKIKSYEARIDLLKKSFNAEKPDDQAAKNLLLKDTVALDAKNAKLRAEVNEMSENIEVLHSQIARLERKIKYSTVKAR